ncbi:hypothetical protein ACVBEJ_01725 [Porticoccus sp. GXU_MW_L64]
MNEFETQKVPWESAIGLLIAGALLGKRRQSQADGQLGSIIPEAVADLRLSATKLLIANKATNQNYPPHLRRITDEEMNQLREVVRQANKLSDSFPQAPSPCDSDWLGELIAWWEMQGKKVPKKCHTYSPFHRLAILYGKALKQVEFSTTDITTRINTYSKSHN